MSDFGILVAPANKAARRGEELRLSSDKNMFKYAKTVLVSALMPETPALNWDGFGSPGSASTDFGLIHELGFVPSFSSFLKGYNDRWGKISKGVQSVGFEGWNAFPYGGTEQVDGVQYTANIFTINNNTSVIPAHTVYIRLTLLVNAMNLT